jgi:hypothetical protein
MSGMSDINGLKTTRTMPRRLNSEILALIPFRLNTTLEHHRFVKFWNKLRTKTIENLKKI